MSKVAKKLMVCAVAASAVGVGSANASLMYSVSGPGTGDAENAETGFQNNLKTVNATEGFEGITAGTQQNSFGAEDGISVGSFTAGTPGNVAYPDGNKGKCQELSCDGGLAVLDESTSPYDDGRFAMPDEPGNKNWLDSMDYDDVTFDVAGGNNAVGFFLTDPNDQNGAMDITVGGEVQTLDFLEDIFNGSEPNGSAYYMTFWSDADIESITFKANNANDGYGIDNVTVGRVPEPGTLALLGLGLVGLGVSRKRAH